MAIEDQIWAALEEVIDPEIGVNIVDLGLVYEVEVDEEKGQAKIEMTLTIPQCPLADQIVQNVENAVKAISGIKEAQVSLVWDPKWSPARMNDRAREEIRSRQAIL